MPPELRIRDFEKRDFAQYQSWYRDALLAKHLEGVDLEWLDYVLDDETGRQFSIIDQANELVAVVGICLPTRKHPFCILTDVAVRPELRRQGVGRSAVGLVMREISLEKRQCWGAYVEENNDGAKAFFESLGWQLQDNDSGEMHFLVSRQR